MRPGERASVIGVFVGAEVPTYREFLAGPVYSVEFADGSAQDIEEALLESLEAIARVELTFALSLLLDLG
jgi:hypothetical protein